MPSGRASAIRVRVASVPRRPGWPGWAVGVVLLWVGLVWVLHETTPTQTLCNFKRVTGVPCPTCGSTRAFTTLLAGDVVGGFKFNPLVLVAGVGLIGLLGVRLLWGRAVRLDLSRGERRATWVAVIALFFLNWAYVIVYVG